MTSTITIDFHGDPLAAILDDARGVLVPLRPLALGMGLNWSGQLQRVRRNPILGAAVCVTHTGSEAEAVCLPLDMIPGFLFTVNAERVDEAIRAKVLDYQRECFRVLAEACLAREHSSPAAPRPAPTERVSVKVALRMVSEARHTFDQQAAREMWFLSGLPIAPSMRRPPIMDLFTHAAARPGQQA